jgi:hypothetical protein
MKWDWMRKRIRQLQPGGRRRESSTSLVRLTLEQLETRLSPAGVIYADFTVVAASGSPISTGQMIDSLSSDLSINNAGRVAMIGNLSSGGSALGAAVLVGDGTGSAANISFPPSASRDYAFPQINDNNQVIARDRLSGAPPATFIRSWDANLPGLSAPVVQWGDPGPLGRYDSVTLGTRAEDGGVGFIGLTGGSVTSALYYRSPTGRSTTVVTTLSGGGFRPLAANGGLFVIRNGFDDNGSILLNNTTIASTSSGWWSSVGAAPGISADGKIVTFYGDLTATGAMNLNNAQPTQTPLVPGRGIFASVDLGAARVIVRVAGVGGSFADFNPDDRVAVNSTLTDLSYDTVAYSAKDASADHISGIYTNQISIGDTSRVSVDEPSKVIKVGDVVASLGGAVTALTIGNTPINNRGQVAFEANIGSNQKIVRAKPLHNPVLVIPGIVGTYAADLEHDSDWLLNRGVPPNQLQVDPLLHVYDDLIVTLTRAGYTRDQDLFVVNYDWRLPVAPPFDGSYDGHIDGLSGLSISSIDGTTFPFQYGVQYLGYYLKKAAETWAQLHPTLSPLDKVDVIAHSTGGLLARTYIQSDAYGDSYGSHNLPTIDHFIMLGVPNRGASKAWNPLHDDWNVEPAFGVVFAQIINRAYQKLLAGAGQVIPVIIGGAEPITLQSIIGGDGQPSPVLFIKKYVPTAKDLLATYDFGAYDPDLENSLLLDLNDGLDHLGSPVTDPNAFGDRAKVIDIYGWSRSTPTRVTQHTGGIAWVQSFTELYWGHSVGSSEVWYSNDYESRNGDGTVPLESSLSQFLGDSRVTKIPIFGADHTGLVSNVETQRHILAILESPLRDDQISQDRYRIELLRARRVAFGSDPVRDALLVDDSGRRLGFTASTGPLTEIPNSMWLGQADGLGFVFGPVGPLHLELTGQGSNYYVKVDEVEDGQFGGVILSGFLGDGEQITFPITLSMLPGYTPPTANDDTFTANENTPTVLDVLANDTNGSGIIDATTLAIATAPRHGGVSVDRSTGLISYTPNTGYLGPDQFTYTVRDFNGAVSNVATVTVTTTNIVRWISHTSGSWLTASNWSTGRVPGPADDVVIDVPEDITVTYNSGYPTVTTIHSLRSENALVIRHPGEVPSAVFVVLTTAVIDNNFTLSIQGFEAREGLTVNGLLTWTSLDELGSGIFTNGQVHANGGMVVSGVYFKSLSGRGTFENTGTVTIVGGGLSLGPDFTLNNLPNATLNIQSNTSVAGGTFNNAGTVRRSIGGLTAQITSVFHNTGTVQVQFGTLSLVALGDGSGSFTVSAGATLEFNGPTQILSSGAVLTGAGDVSFRGGTTYVLGDYSLGGTTVVAGGTVNFTHDVSLPLLTLSAGGVLDGLGTVTVTGLLTWTGGTMHGPGRTVASGGVMINAPSNSNPTLDGRTFDNPGTTVWTGTGPLTALNGAVWNNLAGAVFDARSDLNFFTSPTMPAVFHNAGTLRKSTSLNTTTLRLTLDNTGLVDVQTGTLSIMADGNTGGTFTVTAGAVLDITPYPGVFTFNQASQVMGAGTVSFSQGIVNIAGVYQVGGTTSVAGGTANFISNASLGTLLLSGGALTGPGTVTITDLLSWTGGTMSGPGRTISLVSLMISGTSAKTLSGRTLDNAGVATWTGSGTLNSDYDTTWNNLVGATFEVRNSDVAFDGRSGSVRFNNAGIFRKLASTGTTRMVPAFYNTGMVQVQTGLLSLAGAGVSSGSFSVAAGAVLDFGAGAFDLTTLSPSSSLSGAGEVRFSSGTVFVLGSYGISGLTNVTGGAAQFFSGASTGTLALSAGGAGLGMLQAFGDMTVAGRFDWMSGTLFGPGRLLVSQGPTIISTSANKVLDGGTIDNGGTTNWMAGGLSVANGAVWNNLATATFNIQGDLSINAMDQSLLVFNNSGRLRKSIGTGTTAIGMALNNQGVVEVLIGTLALLRGGTSSGSFAIAAGSEVQLGSSGTSNTFILANGAAISGDGFATAAGDNVIVSGVVSAHNFGLNSSSGAGLTATGSLAVSGTFNWVSGGLSGAGSLDIGASATLNITGSGPKPLAGGTINNGGLTVWSTGDLQASRNAVFNNLAAGVFRILSNQTFADTSSNSLLNNAGILEKTGGGGLSTIQLPFHNSGTVDVHNGTLNFTGGYTQTGGSTLLDGGTLSASTSLNIQGGMLTGSGTINANVVNGGRVDPGASGAGTLTINGNYTQLAGGILNIDIGGLTAGSQYDQLNITGMATLDGTLNITLINSFAPSLGDTFRILTFASEMGMFATSSGLVLGNGNVLNPNYDPMDFTLVVTTA